MLPTVPLVIWIHGGKVESDAQFVIHNTVTVKLSSVATGSILFPHFAVDGDLKYILSPHRESRDDHFKLCGHKRLSTAASVVCIISS